MRCCHLHTGDGVCRLYVGRCTTRYFIATWILLLGAGCAYQRHAAWYIDGHATEAREQLVELAAALEPDTVPAAKANAVVWHVDRLKKWSGEFKRDTGVPEDAPRIPTSENSPAAQLEVRKLAKYAEDIDVMPPLSFEGGGGVLTGLFAGGGASGLLGLGLAFLKLRQNSTRKTTALQQEKAQEAAKAEANRQDALAMVSILNQAKADAPEAVKNAAAGDLRANRLYLRYKLNKVEDQLQGQAAAEAQLPGLS